MKKFKISDKCNACGLCTTMTDSIICDEKGFAHPVDGKVIMKNEMSVASEIIDMCPVKAISIEEIADTTQTGKTGLRELKDALRKRLENIQKPSVSKDQIKFDANNYQADVGNYRCMSGYEYNSSRAAIKAGLAEFDKAAYSQYRRIILSIFVQYKNDKLKPFYTFDENSFYAKNNQKYKKVLLEVLAEAKEITNDEIKLPTDFAEFNVFPGDDSSALSRKDCVIGLSTFEERSTHSGIMEEYRSGSYSSLDSYEMYLDDDSFEMMDGTDWRGNFKTKEKYCYKGVNEAVNEFVKDLKGAMNYVDIDEDAFSLLETAMELYGMAIDHAIKEKISIFEKAVDIWGAGTLLNKSSSEKKKITNRYTITIDISRCNNCGICCRQYPKYFEKKYGGNVQVIATSYHGTLETKEKVYNLSEAQITSLICMCPRGAVSCNTVRSL